VQRRIEWQGSGVDEQGLDAENGQILVSVDPRYFRPTEVDHLLGDASKAKSMLGWEPQITLDQMVEEMVHSDMEAVRLEQGRRQRDD